LEHNNEQRPRKVTADDLGIQGVVNRLDASYWQDANGNAVLRIDMIDAKITNPLQIFQNVISLAKNQGAQYLQIEGSFANPDLMATVTKYLRKMAGVTSGSGERGTSWFLIDLSKF
jgi:hypothetical protein